MAPHNGLADADPDHPVKRATTREINNVRTFMAHCIPELAGQKIQSEVCLYTVTPDRNFWLGLLPGHEHVFITALSGHGFKFAPVLGEILADMLEGSKNPFHVAMFDPARPA